MELSEKIIKELNDRINGVLDYIQKNPLSDPNAFEMNDIMYEMYNLIETERKLGLNLSVDTRSNFNKMMDLRITQLQSEEKGLHATKLAQYFYEQLEVIDKPLTFDYNMKDYMNDVCGVNLYIHQRVRDLSKEELYTEVIYDNYYEYTQLGLKYEIFDINGLSNDLMYEIEAAYKTPLSVFKEQNPTPQTK